MKRSLRSAAVAMTMLLAACDNPAEVPARLAVVEVNPPSTVLPLSDTRRVTAVLRDDAGRALSGRTVYWSSSDHAVATVDDSGLLRSHAVGTATITATSEGKSGSSVVTVPVPDHLLGRRDLHRAAGQPLPAVVFEDSIPLSEGPGFHLRVVAIEGHLVIAGDGTYTRETLHHSYIDGGVPLPQRNRDHGECLIRELSIRCSSTVVVNVSFQATAEAGRIHLLQDMVGEGLPVAYTFAPVP